MVINQISNLGLICCPEFNSRHDALIEADMNGGFRTWSTQELNDCANVFTTQLQERNLAAGTRIALISENNGYFLAAYLGILRAGLVAVPLNYRLPAQKIDEILVDCDPALLYIGRLPDSAPTDSLESRVPRLSLEEISTSVSSDIKPVEVARTNRGDPALILYTSGSTGRPKGVVISHGAYLWTLEMRLKGRDLSDECYLVAAPLYHMNALNTIQLGIAGGARVVVQPRFEARAYAHAVALHRCTSLTGLPTMIALLHQASATQGLDMGSVHTVRLGSETLTERTLAIAQSLFPAAAVGNAYGTTETGSVVLGPRSDGRQPPSLGLGWPQPGVQLRLRNADGKESDQGVLEVRSPGLMLGYHGLPEQTKQVMTTDGYYITGDIMRRDADGCHAFIGREDDMFVCGGENIYPSDIEHLLETHPDIEQACVVPVGDSIKGHKPVALIVPRAGSNINEQAVRDYTLRNGPAHQHPRRVFIVTSLPRSATGKTDRKAGASMVVNFMKST